MPVPQHQGHCHSSDYYFLEPIFILQILSFVFEQKFDPEARRRFSRTLWEAAVYAEASLTALDTDAIPGSLEGYTSRQEVMMQLCNAADPDSEPETLTLRAVFVAHCLILETLPLQARAQHLPLLHPALIRILLDEILPEAFTNVTSMILASRGIAFDMDGRVFAHLLHYLISDPQRGLSGVLGHNAQAWLEDVVDPAVIGNDCFARLRNLYPSQQLVHKQDHLPSPRPLLAFHHPVFDDDLKDINVDIGVESDDDEDTTVDPMHFGAGTVFKDTAHWHNHKRAILPKYLGGEDAKPLTEWQRRKKLKRDQFFMARMNKHAQTLTGALGTQLQRQVIPLAGRLAKDRKDAKKPVQRPVKEIEDDDALNVPTRKTKGKPGKEPKMSSADKLRMKIKAEKTSKTVDELTAWWDEQLSQMEKMQLHERITQTDLLQRGAKAREGWLAVEIRVWRLHLELTDWIAHADAALDATRDRYTVSILRMVKSIYDMTPLSTAILGVLASVLMSLGLEAYIAHFESSFESNSERVDSTERKLRFAFVKVIKSKSGSAVHKFMKIKEHPIVWQLRLYGEFMDRSMDSTYDRRVMFMPDAWQRKVLDCLDDDGHSVLVVGMSTFMSEVSGSERGYQHPQARVKLSFRTMQWKKCCATLMTASWSTLPRQKHSSARSPLRCTLVSPKASNQVSY
jgi:hypothetical protein